MLDLDNTLYPAAIDLFGQIDERMRAYIAEFLGLDPQYPLKYLVYFLIVVAVGGLGRVTGVFYAALLIGVLDFALKKYLPQGGTLFIYALTIALLLEMTFIPAMRADPHDHRVHARAVGEPREGEPHGGEGNSLGEPPRRAMSMRSTARSWPSAAPI